MTSCPFDKNKDNSDNFDPLFPEDILLIIVQIVLIILCFYFAFTNPYYWLVSLISLAFTQAIAWKIKE